MSDFYEIDFLAVETRKSGDAITIHYSQGGVERIHVVDGGFTEMGETILAHIDANYGELAPIDCVVLTHPDGDHARGLKHVLQNRAVGALVMNRPWLFAEELLPRTRFQTADSLRDRLREEFPNTFELEKIALERGVPIYDGFQGQQIGAFTVLAPTRSSYGELVLEASDVAVVSLESIFQRLAKVAEKTVASIKLVASAWGTETFSPNETSPRNEMSIVQFARLSEQDIMLTGDAGRRTLGEAVDYAHVAGLMLPGIDKFQVPHHGSRRNVSTELLDRILGPRLVERSSTSSFLACISSAKADEDHPRASVVRAMIHRGGSVFATEGTTLCFSKNRQRAGWSSISPMPYPESEESA